MSGLDSNHAVVAEGEGFAVGEQFTLPFFGRKGEVLDSEHRDGVRHLEVFFPVEDTVVWLPAYTLAQCYRKI